jgi:hypothetical protein
MRRRERNASRAELAGGNQYLEQLAGDGGSANGYFGMDDEGGTKLR